MLSNKLFPPWTSDGGKQGRERLASGSPRAQASVRGSPCACRARSWRQGCRKMQVNFTAHDPTADHWRFGVLLGGISRPLYAGWLTIAWQRQNPDQVSRARDIISSGLSPRVLPLLLQPPSRPQLVDSVESSIELYRLLFNCI